MNLIFNDPKVIISYSHDSQEHKDRVLSLSDLLRTEGINCILDQYEEVFPEGLQLWMEKQIRDADYVLLICTKPYYKRVMNEEEPGKGHGVRWEGNLIYQHLYSQGTLNKKFIPVLLETGKTEDIPTPLRGFLYYRPETKEGYEALYRRLTGQPLTPKPEIGQMQQLPPRERKQFFFNENQNTSLRQEILSASQGLLNWPRMLGSNQQIARPELEQLLSRIKSDEFSVTLILGGPGSGKSAMLAILGHHLIEEEYALLAIKADFLGSTINTLEDLRRDDQIHLSMNPRDAIKAIANRERVVLLVDQLDAVSELLDRQPGRLNVLLTLIQSVSGTRNVHIVATCREFEFRHGTQFSRMEDVDRLDLSLPTWEQISPILLQAGHNPTSMGEPLRELLCTPLHLKLFLEVAQPGEAFDSLQNLLGKLWEQRILYTQEAQDCITLLERLARRMRDEEVLWLPASVADDYPEACKVLEQAEILTRERGNLIGFWHQTYYDYTLARAFARGSVSLADFVLERQDGLFVRPNLLSSLNYLRFTARVQYQQQLQTLLSNSEQHRCALKNRVSRLAQTILKRLPDKTRIWGLSALRSLRLIYVRTHIHTLVIEFVGGQKDPDPVETSLIIPLLNSETEGQRVLAAIVGSPGWFACLRYRPELRQWLEKPPTEAAYCVPVLSTAVLFAAEDVWNLIENCWLDDSTYDFLSIRVMLNGEQWTTQRVMLAERVIRRSGITWYDTSAIAERIAESLPELAPGFLRADLNRRLDRAIKEGNKPKPELPPDADEAQRYIHDSRHNPLNPLENLIKDESELDNIEAFAGTLPKFFLDAIWPWFIDVMERIVLNGTSVSLTSYRNDYLISVKFQTGAIVKALLVAVLALAAQEPQVFLNFVQQNVSSDLIAVHCLLACGLERIASQQPQRVLEYLLGDPRRLSLGDTWDRNRETKRLIAAVFPHLTSKDRICIEEAILVFNYYTPDPLKQPADFRFQCLRWNRQYRLRLLRALSYEDLSPEAKQLKNGEERALPETRDEDSNYPTISQAVGPRMTDDEMTLASDLHLLNLFNELSDTTEWYSPRRRWSDDSSRAGGAIQQSREFGELAKADPERAIRIIQSFEPHRHEIYVSQALDDISETDFSAGALINLVETLDQRGFASDNFRSRASSALEKLARRNQGLPKSVSSRLEAWLAVHTEPQLSRYQSLIESKTESRKSPILFGVGGSHILPQGRGSIVRAIAASYLNQNPPDLDNWTRVVRSRLGQEQHPDVWVDILVNMPPLLDGNPVQATELFDAVIRNCPVILHYEWALYFISRTIGWFKPKEIVQGWLEILLAESSIFCYQAYGELLLVHYFQYQDSWSIEKIRYHLTNAVDEAVLCGLAHAASHFWIQRRCRVIATEIICFLASYSLESVQRAVASVFRCTQDNFELDLAMRQIIQAICKSKPVLLEAASDLIELIEPLTATEPKLVSQVCQSILKAVEPDIDNPNKSLAHLAEILTTIAITLHRQPTYREVGLHIFEELLALNMRETRSALEILDRKPTCQSYLPPRPRRLRRRRQTYS